MKKFIEVRPPPIVRAGSIGSRRAFLAGAAIAGLGGKALATASTTIPSFTVGPGVGPTGFPGQSGNPVGYTAPGSGTGGSLTPATAGQLAGNFTSGTAGSPTIISGVDFNFGTQSNGNNAAVTLGSGKNYIHFVGCRFQSNNVGFGVNGGGIQLYLNGCTNIVFSYCSFTPLVTLYTSPPGGIWPSAGAGANTTTQTVGVNCINGSSGYEFALLIGNASSSPDSVTGPVTVDHCDIWGMGDGICHMSTTQQMTITNNWIHDGAAASPIGYHQDGIGYLNNLSGTSNVLVQGNTIASIGNTNALAWQGTNGAGFINLINDHNYFTGYGYICRLPGPSYEPNNGGCTFTNNVISTYVQAEWGMFYLGDNLTSFYTPTNWHGNTIDIVPGTSPSSGASWPTAFTPANNGKFILPNGTLSTVDY